MSSLWYTTINGTVRFIRVVAVLILVILATNCFIRSRCKVEDVGLQIAVFCVLPVALSLVVNPIRRCLVRYFPISCGHRKCIFTGRTSRTLQSILLGIDQDIPSIEQLRRLQNQGCMFLDDVKDKLEKAITTATFECVFSGSVVERFGIPPCHEREEVFSALDAAVDVMFCPEADNVSFSGQRGNIIAELISKGDGYTPYALLRPVRLRFEGDLVNSRNVRRDVSSAIGGTKIKRFPDLPKAWYNRCIFKPRVQISTGTVSSISIGNICHAKIMIGIKCREWPPHSDWPKRQRCWPSQEDVTRIVSHGCHLVAKPAPFDNEQVSWRFSFSAAEVELSSLVPNTARKCFLALKIILKDHLQPVVAGITSYHLKTIFLNTLEKTPVDVWVDENIEECFSLLLNEFHDGLASGNCLHHWLKTVNLFDGLEPKNLSLLVWKMKKIQENPAPFIVDGGSCCVLPCSADKPAPHTIDVLAEFGDVELDVMEDDQQSSQSFGQRACDGDIPCDVMEDDQQNCQSFGQRACDGGIPCDVMEDDQQSSQSYGQRAYDGDIACDVMEDNHQSSQSFGQRACDGDIPCDVMEDDHQSSQSLGQRACDGDIACDVMEDDQQNCQSFGQRVCDD